MSFGEHATEYDAFRGALLPDHTADRLVQAAGLDARARILDVGGGTGRVAIPLAQRGFDIVCLDVAREMLTQIRRKAGQAAIRLATGSGTRLPFHSAAFDAAVIARLLYLVPDWRTLLDETRRVLKPNGVVLHEWGNGSADEEWVQIREHLKDLLAVAGLPDAFHRGARSQADVDGELRQRRFMLIDEVIEGSQGRLRPSEFLRNIADGAYSYTWNVPAEVLRPCLEQLNSWAAEQFDLHRQVAVPRQVRWNVYRLAV